MEVCIFEYDEEATLQYIRQDEFQQGKAEGIAEGMAEGIAGERSRALLEVLKAKGNVPQKLKEKIQAQKDPEILRQWFTEALHAETVEVFEKEIEKQRIYVNG